VVLSEHHGVDPARFGVELMAKETTVDGKQETTLVTAVREQNPDTGESKLVPRDPISFQWIAPAAISVNIIMGCLGSLLFPRKAAEGT
jgi:hypothetical protein